MDFQKEKQDEKDRKERIQLSSVLQSITKEKWGNNAWRNINSLFERDICKMDMDELKTCIRLIYSEKVKDWTENVLTYFLIYVGDAFRHESERELLMKEPELSAITSYCFCYSVLFHHTVPCWIWRLLWYTDHEKDLRFQKIREELNYCVVTFKFE